MRSAVMFSQDFQQVIAKAGHVLKGGGLVAYPTDTVYGLGADVFNGAAVEGVFRTKGRPPGEGLPVLIATLADLEVVAATIPPLLDVFVRHFWPGQLTLVLRRHPRLPKLVTGGKETVAVRLPDHPVPRALVLECGHPITGTSANRSGGPDPVTAEEVRGQLGEAVDMVIDGGRCPGGVPSTILDVTVHPPAVLRRGAVPVEALEGVSPVGLAPARRR